MSKMVKISLFVLGLVGLTFFVIDKEDVTQDVASKNEKSEATEYVKVLENSSNLKHNGLNKIAQMGQVQPNNKDEQRDPSKEESVNPQKTAYMAYQSRMAQRNEMIAHEQQRREHHRVYMEKSKENQMRIAAMMKRDQQYKEQYKNVQLRQMQLKQENMMRTIEKNRALNSTNS